jgi:hypothetical protein
VTKPRKLQKQAYEQFLDNEIKPYAKKGKFMPMIPGEDRLNRHFRKRSFLTKIMSPPVY